MNKILPLTLVALLLTFSINVKNTSATYTDVSDRYLDAVNHIVNANYANGESATQFGTSSPIKRIDAAVMVARAMGFNKNTQSPSAGFTDVPKDRIWAVDALAENGVINGKKPGTYGSEQFMTRAEMAKVLAFAYGLKASNTSIPFTDVSKTFLPYVAALVENEIAFGKTDTSFGATQNVTRGEFAIFIYRADNLSADIPPEVEDVS